MGYRSIAEFAIYLQIMKGETKTHEFRVDKYGFLQPFCDSVRYLPIVGGGGPMVATCALYALFKADALHALFRY